MTDLMSGGHKLNYKEKSVSMFSYIETLTAEPRPDSPCTVSDGKTPPNQNDKWHQGKASDL